jgi:hypothetical protein
MPSIRDQIEPELATRQLTLNMGESSIFKHILQYQFEEPPLVGARPKQFKNRGHNSFSRESCYAWA